VHHALFELAGFGEFGFEGSDFGIHIGEDGGDRLLFLWVCKLVCVKGQSEI
jgi:hypothetical protein